MVIKINDKSYKLLNPEKCDRALNGIPNPSGKVGGVIKSDGTYDKMELLNEYDKLGGAITLNGDKVKIGSFYDFRNKRKRETPQIVFEFRINGKLVEVPEGEETPIIVKAKKIMDEEEGKKRIKKEETEEEVEEEKTEEANMKVSELTKLSKDELIKLAEEKGFKISEDTTRDILIDFLYGKV